MADLKNANPNEKKCPVIEFKTAAAVTSSPSVISATSG